MVPEGWREASLSSLLETIIDYRGKAPPKTESGVRLITARNVRFGFVSFDHEEYIDADLFIEWMNRGLPQIGDILFTTEAPLGNVAMFPEGGPFALGQRIVTLRTGSKASPDFLFQFLISEIGQDRIFQKASGSTALGIKSRELQKVLVLLPPLAEQKRIAEVLGVWDRAIEVAGKQLDLARTQKRALMQTLLTPTRRFPGYEGRPWKEVRLGDVVEVAKDRNDPKKSDEPLRCIELEHIEQETGRLLGFVLSSDQASIKAVFRKGDVLFGKLRPYLRKFHFPDFSGVCSTEIWVLRPRKANLVDRFLYYLIQGDGFMAVAEKSSGSKMPRADWKIVAEYYFRLPPIEEQGAIAATLETADAEITTLETQITRLQAEKKALMQQLLTGQKRLAV